MTEKIQFVDLKAQYAQLKSAIDARIAGVLAHGQYIMGPEVRELEDALERRTGVANCITVASGTEALLIALMAIGVKPGDEVITTPFTFVATAEVIALAREKGIVFLKADKTAANPAIEAKLQELGRSAIPVNVLLIPGEEPVITPEVLTPGYLKELFGKVE